MHRMRLPGPASVRLLHAGEGGGVSDSGDDCEIDCEEGIGVKNWIVTFHTQRGEVQERITAPDFQAACREADRMMGESGGGLMSVKVIREVAA